MTTPDQVKQEILEELKEAHAEMFSGKLSPLYLDKLMSTAIDRYGEAVQADTRAEERAFILNVLDGIDIADGKCNTKAIRHALSTRVV